MWGLGSGHKNELESVCALSGTNSDTILRV
jgi:hypothetical protein